MLFISIIGGSGFVGTCLIDQLKNKFTITNLDKQQSKKYPELTTIINIEDKQALLPLLKEQDLVILLAAEHRDDVSPVQLYYDVNVQGTKNVLDAMDNNGLKNIIFTSSVAVYGLNKINPNEQNPVDPFNHYGKSKWQAEQVLRDWYKKDSKDKSLSILRPTVIFGERNRGNVYNLLKQIASGRFMKIGKCENKKSLSYVGNVVAFIEYLICKSQKEPTYCLYNYIDKPDLSMNQLVQVVGKSLNKKIPAIKIPYSIGMLAGYGFDFLSWVIKKKLSVSSIRVKKFCATTQFDATKAHALGFVPPYTLEEGLDRTIHFEFVEKKHDDIIYFSE